MRPGLCPESTGFSPTFSAVLLDNPGGFLPPLFCDTSICCTCDTVPCESQRLLTIAGEEMGAVGTDSNQVSNQHFFSSKELKKEIVRGEMSSLCYCNAQQMLPSLLIGMSLVAWCLQF